MYSYNRTSAKVDPEKVREDFAQAHEDVKALYQELLGMESLIEGFEARIEAVPDNAPSADYRKDIQNAKKSVLKALKDAPTPRHNKKSYIFWATRVGRFREG